jgi:hypothetical protein
MSDLLLAHAAGSTTNGNVLMLQQSDLLRMCFCQFQEQKRNLPILSRAIGK